MKRAVPIPAIVRALRDARRVAITSHLRPDGDSLCTGLALAMMIEASGRSAAIVNRDPTPLPFSVHPDAGRIRVGQIDPAEFDLVVLLECADVSRSGQERLGRLFKVNIDHHASNSPFADINWIDPSAAAVGEMVFALGEAWGAGWTPAMAEHLYCAIVSDTGCFQFSNTSARALEVCSRLAALGARPIRVSEMLYGNNPPEKVKLLGIVLSRLTMTAGGRIAVISMFRRDLEALGLRELDTEDITTQARSIKGVQMVLFFKEMEPDTFRVSCRSRGAADSARVAERFGGGGHVHASGFTVHGPFERLVREIPAVVEGMLDAAVESSAGAPPDPPARG